MTDSEWMLGFSIATRLYYTNGNLDIPEDAVTNGGYKIGEWIKYTRENVDKISAFDINNLASYGFIWGKSRGIHKSFSRMCKKLQTLKKNENGIISLTAIKDDPELVKWVNMIVEGRKACDNAVITLREIEILTSIGFPWGDKWPYRQVEESAWVSKNSMVALAIRNEAMRLAGNNKRSIEIPKTEPIVETKVVQVDNSVWQDRLLRIYLGIDKCEVSSEDKLQYLLLLKKDIKSEQEKNFLKMLNNGKAGEAAWIVGKVGSIDFPSTVKEVIPILNNWADSEIKLGTNLRTYDLSKCSVENGWSVEPLMDIIYKAKNEVDKRLIKHTLNATLYLRYLDVTEASTDKKTKSKAEKPKAEKTKAKKSVKKAEQKVAPALEETKKEKLANGWTVKKPRDWFKMLTCELERAGKDTVIVPNNVDEAALIHNDRLVELITEAYENRNKLMGKLYINNLREYGFFFIEKSTDDIDKLRRYYKLLMERFGIRAYSKIESKHSRQIVSLLNDLKTTNVDEEIINNISNLLEMDFDEYDDFMKVYKQILANGKADEIEIAQEIRRSIPLAMKSKKIRA